METPIICAGCGAEITIHEPEAAGRVVCANCGRLQDAPDPLPTVIGAGGPAAAVPPPLPRRAPPEPPPLPDGRSDGGRTGQEASGRTRSAHLDSAIPNPASPNFWPSTALFLVAVVGIMVNVGAAHAYHEERANRNPPTRRPGMTDAEWEGARLGAEAAPATTTILVAIPTVLVYGLVVWGSREMQRYRSPGLARAAAVLAMMPCGPAVLVGLPVGIWALVTLNRPDVVARFDRAAREGGAGPSMRRRRGRRERRAAD